MCFWHVYENTVKPFKEIKGLNVENNFLDHGKIFLIFRLGKRRKGYGSYN
jgi:hypothetical protein